MDLRFIPNAEPAQAERDALDLLFGAPSMAWDGGSERAEFEGHYAVGGHEARSNRHLLLPALHVLQETSGYITEGGLNYICRRLSVPPAEAFSVASFYALFSMEERPPIVAHVCDDIACRCLGAKELMADLEARLGPPGSPTMDGRATWITSPCLGRCESAPVVMVQRARAYITNETDYPDSTIVHADADAVVAALGGGPEQESPSWDETVPQSVDPEGNGLRLLRRIGRVDPTSLDAYRATGGYEGLRQAIELGPEGVIREIKDSNILGRGGAAFPAGRKMEDVARQPAHPHYLVCNADESEPGTFKDRVLMEGDPFALIEAMTIAGYAAGCEVGFLFLRGEYPVAVQRIANAIEAARHRGLLGENVMDAGFDFDIELRLGAGAYICGEETALFNAIEGYRGEPRNKPPYPTQAGLFGVPTLVNNVETLCNFPDIIVEGGQRFAQIGTAGSTGTKLFCLSGAVKKPGTYELPFGATLRQLIDLAGGLPEGRTLQAILLGGAAGTFVTADDLDMELTFEGTRAAGASLGSGVIMVFDDTADMVDVLLRIAAFFRDESCGQCVPCRIGTVRQQEALQRLAAGKPLESTTIELQLLDDVALVMRDASICGLGQTAPNAVLSGMAKLHLFQNGRGL